MRPTRLRAPQRCKVERQPWPECGVTVRITPTVVVGASSCQSCRIQHSVPAPRFPARRADRSPTGPRKARPDDKAPAQSAVLGSAKAADYAFANPPCPLLRFPRKSNPAASPATKQPDGQITSVFPKSSQAPDEKIFRFRRRANHWLKSAVSPDERGVAHVTNARVGCGGRESCD